MRLRFLLWFSLLAFAVPAIAQDGPSFDCGKAQSSAEKMICDKPELAKLDRLVAERFADAVKIVEGLDAGAEEAVQDLRAHQRGWVSGRDECWKSDDLESCIRWNYLRRDAELVARYMLEKPTATTTWQCGDSPANELVSSYFDTELPGVRIERGDSVTVGSLSRTASGSRYDAEFGEFLWIKGDEAQYRAPDPDGAEMTCNAVQ